VTRTIVRAADAYGMRPLHVDVIQLDHEAGRAGDGAPSRPARRARSRPRPRQLACRLCRPRSRRGSRSVKPSCAAATSVARRSATAPP
jgi:hypothetical protein